MADWTGWLIFLGGVLYVALVSYLVAGVVTMLTERPRRGRSYPSFRTMKVRTPCLKLFTDIPEGEVVALLSRHMSYCAVCKAITGKPEGTHAEP